MEDIKMIFEKVQDVIAEQLSVDKEEVKLESRIKQDLDADSLDAVEIAMALEDVFEKSIPDEELAGFVTVSDIVKYIESIQ